ncbi:MAG: hypothetical protein Q9M28_12235 [Mariprofundaceae bacterium]|nr:hypothetical protein [Mariprofundaceae bacterium]
MKIIIYLSICLCWFSTSAHAFDLNQAISMGINAVVQQTSTTKAPTKLLNSFMEKLLIADFDQSAKQVMPYVHPSNYDATGTALDRDLLNFSFKKAHQNAKFYAHPVKITRSQALKTTNIGHPSRGTYQKGTEMKYWVAKKQGVNGMPAPLVVFFPADGAAPSISYMGSL